MKTIHISIGDPGGIGPEIVVKACRDVCNDGNVYIIHGDRELVEASSGELCSFITNEPSHVLESGVYFRKLHLPTDFARGVVDKRNGGIAAQSIISASKACKKDEYVVTAPINKESLNAAGYHYQGHTEMLGELSGSSDVFMSFWGGINTLLLTSHVSMDEAVKRVRDESYLYNKIKNSYSSIKRVIGDDFRPVIAGLNPHAGENGLMGTEEDGIRRVLRRLNKEGIAIEGPLPSDTLFASYLSGRYNFIYTLYHDQALIPIKTFFMDRTLNMTLGLPYIRVSPDHGTAFDIAGKCVADYKPMKFCFEFISSLK